MEGFKPKYVPNKSRNKNNNDINKKTNTNQNGKKTTNSNQNRKNMLLEQKWKKRTHDTHLTHLDLYRNKSYQTALLGDSMFERWKTTGIKMWEEMKDKVANLGVGGDGIEHLLYRIEGNDQVESILDVIQLERIILMIGTNNVEKKSVQELMDGLKNVIGIILKKKPSIKLVVCALFERIDVPAEKVQEYNKLIENHVNELANQNVSFKNFGDSVNHSLHQSQFYDDKVHLNLQGYEKWHEELTKLI